MNYQDFELDLIGILEDTQGDVEKDVFLPLLKQHFCDDMAYDVREHRDYDSVTNFMHKQIYEMAYKIISETACEYAGVIKADRNER